VRVDPRTNRAVVEGPGGYETQLWDGVHRLSDGTELIVRDGRVVPNRQILDQGGAAPEPPLPQETPQAVPPRSPAAAGRDFCSDLVRQSCGSDNACSDATKCSAAHQLQRMAAEERARGADPAAPVEADLKCREALRNDFFAPCEAGAKP
jgi:hypothetical protein